MQINYTASHNLILGDCLDIMNGLDSDRFDLIYLDPPFFSGKQHSLVTRDGSKNYNFMDVWDCEADYTKFIYSRIQAMYRILKNTGSIFVHCDSKASHIIRNILDNIFGADKFRAEIIWHYKRWSNGKNGLLAQHQTILYYSKTDNYKFNKQFANYSATTNIDQILQKRERDHRGKAIYATNNDGSIAYCEEKKGVPLGDVWEIPFLNPKAHERTGYPTQKPIILLEKIINLASDEGDEILDPFCGSGTSCVAAKLLNRKFLGIDISEDAIQLAKNRLDNPIKTQSVLLQKGEEAYIVSDDWVNSHLIGIDCNMVARNYGIDAILRKNINGCIGLIRVQRKEESVLEASVALIKAAKSKPNSKKILVRTSDDLFRYEPDDIYIIDSVSLQLSKIEYLVYPRDTVFSEYRA